MESSKRTPLYTPDWEPVAAAITRITATGADEIEAKTALCQAIADEKIDVRATTARGTYRRKSFSIPKHLKPEEIDWRTSRPLEKWWIGSWLGDRYYDDGGYEHLELLEVRIEDVVSVFRLASTTAIPNGLTEAEVESLFRNLRRENQRLTQTKAVKIVQARGAIPDREKLREIFNRVAGPQKTGPNGPRDNRAAGGA